MTVFLSTSDVSAAIVGAGYSYVIGLGNPGMYAVRSLVVSMLSRMASEAEMLQSDNFDANQKNELIVAILSAIDGYVRSRNQSVFKSILSGVSVDLIGQEILKTMRLEDKAIVGGT